MTAAVTPTFALAMTPLDWGIHIAAVVLLVFAARTIFTGKGKSQMGAGFAIMASILWTLAIGRHIPGFSILDGVLVGLGVLFLVPVLRVLFTHTGGSVTTAAISAILASALAGPVVGRYWTAVTTDRSPAIERLKGELTATEAEIESLNATRERVAGFASDERQKLEAFGAASSDEIEGNSDAMKTLEIYAGYRSELDRLSGEIASLESSRAKLEGDLENLRSGGDGKNASAADEANAIRERVESEASRSKPVVEKYSGRAAMLELFDEEFGDAE